MTKPGQSIIWKMNRKVRGASIPAVREWGGLPVPPRKVVWDKAPMAPAFYVGWQEGSQQVPGFSLYTLIEEIPGHPQWSTVSDKTLEAAGFKLPPVGVGLQTHCN